MNLDRVILGTNSLNGMSHFANDIARARLGRLGTEEIIRVIEASFSAGATAMNLSPTKRLYEALMQMKRQNYSVPFGVYLMLPDMEKFRSTVMAGGTFAVAKELLGDLGWTDVLSVASKGARSILSSDYPRLIESYLHLEIKRLSSILPSGGTIRCVLAHEQLTDLALALKTHDLFYHFIQQVNRKNFIPGFITRNLPLFSDFLAESRIDPHQVVIMTPVNAIGFQMTPSKEEVEKVIKAGQGLNLVAISALAGGQVGVEEGVRYLKSLPGIESVVIGVSTVSHAVDTFAHLRTSF